MTSLVCAAERCEDALLRLASSALAPRRVDRLVERFGSARGAVRAIEQGRTDLSPAVRVAVSVPAEERRAELRRLGVDFSTPRPSKGATGRDTPAWERLARFPGAPRWLYVRGSLPDAPSVAIVGTRTCTAYGAELAKGYGRAAASAGWAVVSGMARGIDGAAHRGALDGCGTTVAVLGSGVDVVYPRRHRGLHDEIVAAGAVVSEFPPGTRPDAWRFPTRNRIISALADIVLVVEAGETGGALITARIALDQGVPVFATPGDVDREVSKGTNRLIRDGAFPVFDPDDLARTLELVTPFAAS